VDDFALVAALRAADPVALHEAWSRHRARIYGFLLRLSRRRDVAEELLQETFLSLAKAAPRLRENTNLMAFLFTIARNQWRSHRRWSFLDLSRWVPLDDHPAVAHEGDLDADLDAKRRVHELERALTTLSTRDREVLLLVGVEGFDMTQAAEILGIRADALRQRLSRARAKLADALVSNSPRRQVQRA
jgi:RNA polymerase sigma-70 factor (ECF subfamily)